MQPSLSKLFIEYQGLVNEKAQISLRLAAIQEKLITIEVSIKDYESQIELLNTPILTKPEPPRRKYKETWTNIQKAVHIVTEKGQFLSVREIVNRIEELEGKTNDPEFDRQLTGTISSTVSTKAKKRELLQRIKSEDRGEYLYGLIGWHGELENFLGGTIIHSHG